MRKLILFIATSLDGYLAGPKGEIDWLFTDQDYGYREFYASVDTALMGRKTYELALSFDEYPYKDVEAVVFSRRNWPANPDVRFVSCDLGAVVSDLKSREGKNIWLVGGAEIVAECLRHDLIDEFVISVHPVILGSGIPLFEQGLPAVRLQFANCQTYNTGLVQIRYIRLTE